MEIKRTAAEIDSINSINITDISDGWNVGIYNCTLVFRVWRFPVWILALSCIVLSRVPSLGGLEGWARKRQYRQESAYLVWTSQLDCSEFDYYSKHPGWFCFEFACSPSVWTLFLFPYSQKRCSMNNSTMGALKKSAAFYVLATNVAPSQPVIKSWNVFEDHIDTRWNGTLEIFTLGE